MEEIKYYERIYSKKNVIEEADKERRGLIRGALESHSIHSVSKCGNASYGSIMTWDINSSDPGCHDSQLDVEELKDLWAEGKSLGKVQL